MITSDQILREINEGINGLSRSEFPRLYLGMSGAGQECLRRRWYEWRFACCESFSPRMKRLFNRGHREEAAVCYWLRLGGFEVYDINPATGEQFEFTEYNGHLKGHCDAVLRVFGIWMVCEIKTFKANIFKQLKRSRSVRISKPEHYSQLQRYMHAMGTNHGLYLAVNKDDDDLYLEVVHYDESTVRSIRDCEKEIITSIDHPPTRCSENDTYYKCRFCPCLDVCFYSKPFPRTCRLCSHVVMGKKGQWLCKGKMKLRPSKQLEGCRKFESLKN